ncbi:unnamed protein product [Diamesa serratosioi]
MPVSTSNDRSKSTNFNEVLKELKKEKHNYLLDSKATEEFIEIENSPAINVHLQELLVSNTLSEGTNLNKTKHCVTDAELAVFKPNKKNYKRNTVEVNENKSKKTTTTKHKLKTSPIEKKRSKLEDSMSVYDYRHHVSNSHVSSNNKNESNNSSYVSKGDNEDDENLINSFYSSGHRYLGGSNNSIATLCNIGNSCYLNSVVYTLRFAPFFLHKLHHLVDDMRQVYQKVGQHKLKSSSLGRNVSGLQNQSARSWSSKDLASLGSNNSHANGSDAAPKNNRQIATEKLHELYQNLHRNESVDTSDPYHAGTFLQSIQDVSSIFEGNQQQDAHELLMCILDSIRETCSALIKTINDHPEVVNEHPTLPEQNELSPSQQQQHHQSHPTSQSIKSIFQRKKRKDTFKVSKSNSPMKENHSEVATVLSAIENDGTGTVIKNNLNSVINNNENSDSNNFFREDFEGITLSTTKCLTCETVTEQKETMVDIAIPISAANDTISDPQMFIQNSCITRETFRVENHYRCDKCCGYTEAIRSISFDVLPRLLVLHIKRFSGGMEKISSYSPTPFVLKCFCNKCYKKRDEDKLHIYKLYSVITHVGATMSVGHYIAYTCSLDIYNEYVNCANDKRRLSASGSGGSNSHNNTLPQQANNNYIEKNTGLMKKLIYGRNKASSNASTNQRSSMNENGYHNHHNNSTNTKPTLNSLNQKIWYMCDDDKIKMMPQREFEELLSRNQKVMITPYLLFYARYDMQTTKETSSD